MDKILELERTPEIKRRSYLKIGNDSFDINIQTNPTPRSSWCFETPLKIRHSIQNGESSQKNKGNKRNFNDLSISFGGQDHFRTPKIVKGDFQFQQYAKKSINTDTNKIQKSLMIPFLQKQKKSIIKLKKREISENILLDKFPLVQKEKII